MRMRLRGSELPVLRIVAVEEPAKSAKNRAFFPAAMAGLRGRRRNASSQAA